MENPLKIAGYCRISVDVEQDRDNTSIENQKSIIGEFAARKFPGAELLFFEDRDRSGYTFEQRESYQIMRPLLMSKEINILIVKDFSRFARRNSRGLVELEDLRDAGVRIISIGDTIDYPTYDDWTAIQFRFLINEMPVTDASKKVKSVIRSRQNDGRWICAVPYGYVLTNSKTMQYAVDEQAAEVIRMIFTLYNDGWGYKKIANHLTKLKIPTPRTLEKERKEAAGMETKIKANDQWSIITVQGILTNDFYIGTLRQQKYRRKKINGTDAKLEECDHIVFENHHEPVVDYRIFATAQEQMKQRTKNHYRGVKINENPYSGYLFCGDCGSPMFAMGRRDLAPAYTCGTYHKRGRSGCASHHTRVEILDGLLKAYIRKIRDNSAGMMQELESALKNETNEIQNNTQTAEILEAQLTDTKEELKMTLRQKVREVMKNPGQEELLEDAFAEIIADLQNRITGLESQIELLRNKRNTMIQAGRLAKTALEIFDGILRKPSLDKTDLSLIIERITIYENQVDIHLKADIDLLLDCDLDMEKLRQGMEITQKARNHRDKILRANVISGGDPLEIYTDNDGEVIFKKYSLIGELAPFAAQYAEVMVKGTGLPVIICDRDHCVAVAGMSRKEVIERRVTQSLEEMMESRRTYWLSDAEQNKLFPLEGVERAAAVIVPIIASGDVSGCVVLLQEETGLKPEEADVKLAQVAAAFLGKQMEE